MAKDIEKSFDPFFSTKFIGRGLGLPVVFGLVQAHRGVITVESVAGQGSVFRVFFPLSAAEVHLEPDKAARVPEMQWSGTVLVVDDDKSILHLTRAMLTMLGFEVLSAGDGLEAVEIFRQHKNEIRFVLTDFGMPHERFGDSDCSTANRSRYSSDSGQWLQQRTCDGRHPSRAPPGLSGKAL
jgi:hypothetical protein